MERYFLEQLDTQESGTMVARGAIVKVRWVETDGVIISLFTVRMQSTWDNRREISLDPMFVSQRSGKLTDKKSRNQGSHTLLFFSTMPRNRSSSRGRRHSRRPQPRLVSRRRDASHQGDRRGRSEPSSTSRSPPRRASSRSSLPELPRSSARSSSPDQGSSAAPGRATGTRKRRRGGGNDGSDDE